MQPTRQPGRDRGTFGVERAHRRHDMLALLAVIVLVLVVVSILTFVLLDYAGSSLR